jgi:hypothetical protein
VCPGDKQEKRSMCKETNIINNNIDNNIIINILNISIDINSFLLEKP